MAKEKDRNWDKELAEVDKLLNQLPTYREEQAATRAAQARSPAAGSTTAGGGSARLSTREWAGTWARVVLGLLVGIGVTQWPYSYECGLNLYVYLGGVAVVFVAGLWSSVSSWRRRLGFAHLLSQILIVGAVVLATVEILPRVGPNPAKHWTCQAHP